MLEDMENIVESDPDRLLQDVARECDWVIADENSNVHLGCRARRKTPAAKPWALPL